MNEPKTMKKQVAVRVDGLVYFGKSLRAYLAKHAGTKEMDLMEPGYVNENGLFIPDADLIWKSNPTTPQNPAP